LVSRYIVGSSGEEGSHLGNNATASPLLKHVREVPVQSLEEMQMDAQLPT